jgi:hypothetical protein
MVLKQDANRGNEDGLLPQTQSAALQAIAASSSLFKRASTSSLNELCLTTASRVRPSASAVAAWLTKHQHSSSLTAIDCIENVAKKASDLFVQPAVACSPPLSELSQHSQAPSSLLTQATNLDEHQAENGEEEEAYENEIDDEIIATSLLSNFSCELASSADRLSDKSKVDSISFVPSCSTTSESSSASDSSKAISKSPSPSSTCSLNSSSGRAKAPLQHDTQETNEASAVSTAEAAPSSECLLLSSLSDDGAGCYGFGQDIASALSRSAASSRRETLVLTKIDLFNSIEANLESSNVNLETSSTADGGLNEDEDNLSISSIKLIRELDTATQSETCTQMLDGISTLQSASKSLLVSDSCPVEDTINSSSSSIKPSISLQSTNCNSCERDSLASFASSYSQFEFVTAAAAVQPADNNEPAKTRQQHSSTLNVTSKSASNSGSGGFFQSLFANKKTSSQNQSSMGHSSTLSVVNTKFDLFASKFLNNFNKKSPLNSSAAANLNNNNSNRIHKSASTCSSSSSSHDSTPISEHPTNANDTQSLKSNHSVNNLSSLIDLKVPSSVLIFENRPGFIILCFF